MTAHIEVTAGQVIVARSVKGHALYWTREGSHFTVRLERATIFWDVAELTAELLQAQKESSGLVRSEYYW